MKIIFVTGNPRKIAEAELACKPAGIKIVVKSVEIDEIQSSEPKKVSLHKAKEAYKKTKRPLVVTDTYWEIPALNGFPGAYMKDVANWFTETDFINLVKNKDDNRIFFSENITFFDGKQSKQFSKKFEGKIVEPRGTGTSIENVAEFDGITLGERRESGGLSHAADDYVWSDFVVWYKQKHK